MPRSNPSTTIGHTRRKYVSVTTRFHWPWSDHLARATVALHPDASDEARRLYWTCEWMRLHADTLTTRSNP